MTHFELRNLVVHSMLKSIQEKNQLEMKMNRVTCIRNDSTKHDCIHDKFEIAIIYIHKFSHSQIHYGLTRDSFATLACQFWNQKLKTSKTVEYHVVG